MEFVSLAVNKEGNTMYRTKYEIELENIRHTIKAERNEWYKYFTSEGKEIYDVSNLANKINNYTNMMQQETIQNKG